MKWVRQSHNEHILSIKKKLKKGTHAIAKNPSRIECLDLQPPFSTFFTRFPRFYHRLCCTFALHFALRVNAAYGRIKNIKRLVCSVPVCFLFLVSPRSSPAAFGPSYTHYIHVQTYIGFFYFSHIFCSLFDIRCARFSSIVYYLHQRTSQLFVINLYVFSFLVFRLLFIFFAFFFIFFFLSVLSVLLVYDYYSLLSLFLFR